MFRNCFFDDKTYLKTSSKFGSIIGDHCRIGAYTMTYPGVTMGKNCVALPHLMIKEVFYANDSKLYLQDYYTHTVKKGC